MMLGVRDFGRLQDIVSVLIRYGFGDVVRRMGLADSLERAGKILHWKEADEVAQLEPPARVRRVLEELGPTFIKLGQVMATRVDLFSPEWIAEFSKLQDHAPIVPYSEVQLQLTEDLGEAPEKIFADFHEVPLAAASIAQVYRARLDDGSEVVVKVRRPGIRTVVEADLRLLQSLAQLAEKESEQLKAFHPSEVVRQFATSLHNELDFSVESRNAERIAENFSGYTDPDSEFLYLVEDGALVEPDPVIVIPRVYWQWTGERVCTQEFIDGIPGRNLDEVERQGLDRKVLARRGVRAVLKMMLLDGLFHADPHQGNLFYLAGNRIAFVDFGMVGRLSEERRDQLVRLLLGLVRHDARRVSDIMLDWADNNTNIDEQHLTSEVEAFIEQYRGVPLKQLNFGSMLSDLVGILRGHGLALPADLALLMKAFITLEGLGRQLDPDFSMAPEAQPMLEEVYRSRFSPDVLMKRGWRAAEETMSLLNGLPKAISRLVRAVERGRVEVHIEVAELKRVGNQLDTAANRLVIGMVVAALLIGSAIVMTVPGGPVLFGLPLFGLLGFLGAVIGGLWLMLAIRKSSKVTRD